ncbi:hypothetical protein ANCCAN_21316 [Ancylostoma caninum]|uniref:Uncharacterized protein n=1 Tax=Ancylostoma caninum TaxID=29170 RepID=A0A368FKW5_ANCCA|nr:hypothetical protein ANCCAN_21316 [Ancylostoma caninum]
MSSFPYDNDAQRCREEGLDIVQYPVFRVFQVIYSILSVASIPALLYLMVKCFQIIFLMYYSGALLHAVSYPIIQVQ